MHTLHSAFILGYHGCDRDVGERLLAGEPFRQSDNEYDWLGHGIYFWEANPMRGLEFAREVQSRHGKKSSIKNPWVIGAIIEPRVCLDLMTSSGISVIKESYKTLKQSLEYVNCVLPENSKDLLRRNLDCMVVNLAHLILQEQNQPKIDTVKGVFVEGDEVYPGAGFREKNHIQICVCNPDCIKGVFRVDDRFLI
ncbi:MAG: hypothetical protein NUV50_12840 [Rhodospirillales bacterium]|nr:hypothetical protein [Rhodospirillales bacterium]